MKKTPLRIAGNLVSLNSGWAAKFLHIPHGTDELMFGLVGSLGAMVGYNFGTWYGNSKRRRAITSTILVGAVVVLYFAYYFAIQRLWPSVSVVALLLVLFFLIFFFTFLILALLQVQTLED